MLLVSLRHVNASIVCDLHAAAACPMPPISATPSWPDFSAGRSTRSTSSSSRCSSRISRTPSSRARRSPTRGRAIALAITLTLAMRPIGAIVFGLMADRYGRRLPLMLNVVFYATISVLCGFAQTYWQFIALRMLFGIGMGGEWGVGASLALESRLAAHPRAAVRAAAGRLRHRQPARRARLPHCLSVGGRALPGNAWRVMFFLGGLPALLSLFIRMRVKESEAWHEHRTDWANTAASLLQNARRFLYLVLLMTVMNFMSHGTQDMYPTLLRHLRLRQGADRRHHDAVDDRRGARRARLRRLLRSLRAAPRDDHRRQLRPGRSLPMWIAGFSPIDHDRRRVPDAVLRAGRVGHHPGAHQRTVARARRADSSPASPTSSA